MSDGRRAAVATANKRGATLTRWRCVAGRLLLAHDQLDAPRAGRGLHVRDGRPEVGGHRQDEHGERGRHVVPVAHLDRLPARQARRLHRVLAHDQHRSAEHRRRGQRPAHGARRFQDERQIARLTRLVVRPVRRQVDGHAVVRVVVRLVRQLAVVQVDHVHVPSKSRKSGY